MFSRSRPNMKINESVLLQAHPYCNLFPQFFKINIASTASSARAEKNAVRPQSEMRSEKLGDVLVRVPSASSCEKMTSTMIT